MPISSDVSQLEPGIPHRPGSPISGRAAVFHSQQGDVVADRIVAAPFIECADQGVQALR